MDDIESQRRRLLLAAAACGALGARASRAQPLDAPHDVEAPHDVDALPPEGRQFAARPPLAPVVARADRLIDINVCTRPFRAQGPRMELEHRFGKTLVHNYGHGGSGWSLSWGCAKAILPWVLSTRESRVAVIGCGVIGLTSARIAQRAGLKVRIYAREWPPEVRSTGATGSWTPDSRLCLAANATPGFVRAWETLARAAWKMHQAYVGVPGEPVAWHEGYFLSDVPFDQPVASAENAEPAYAELEREYLGDLRPRSRPLGPDEHPFPVAYARRYMQVRFDVHNYQRLLLEDFLREGGELVQHEFVHARDLARVRERTLIHATGYGARALLRDESIVPVRGQTARLIPQPEVDYGLIWRGHNLVMVPRHDGLLVQAQGEHDYGNEDDTVDRAQSEAAVTRLASLFTGGGRRGP
jgi:glycine/D-amino acid oxidase-like deaminating enzyme